MTNPTPHGQQLGGCPDCGSRNCVARECTRTVSHKAQAPNQPGGFSSGDMASAAAQGYRDGWTAAQAISAEPAAHVQKPAEIEHVAGDVSKNGPESNMAQQPAPSAASKAVLAAIRAANMQLVRTGDDEFMLVTYKNAKAQCDGGKCGIGGYCDDCPTPQADSQPAPVAPNYKQALWSKNCMQCCVSYMLGLPLNSAPDFATDGGWELFSEFVDSKGYAAVMLPGNHEFEADYLASGTTARGTSHMVVMNDGKLVHDPHPSNAGLTEVRCVWLLAKKATPQRDDREDFEACAKAYTSNVSFERDGDDYEDMTASLLWHGWKLRAARAPADSVLEDAARYRWLRRWKGQEHEPPFTVQHEIDGTLWGGDLDAAIDAARAAQKEGEKP